MTLLLARVNSSLGSESVPSLTLVDDCRVERGWLAKPLSRGLGVHPVELRRLGAMNSKCGSPSRAPNFPSIRCGSALSVFFANAPAIRCASSERRLHALQCRSSRTRRTSAVHPCGPTLRPCVLARPASAALSVPPT